MVTQAPTAPTPITSRRHSRKVVARYQGTRLGRQELDGEIIEDRADALWSRAMIETCRVMRRRNSRASWSRSIRRPRPRKRADACGIVAAGIAEDGMFM